MTPTCWPPTTSTPRLPPTPSSRKTPRSRCRTARCGEVYPPGSTFKVIDSAAAETYLGLTGASVIKGGDNYKLPQSTQVVQELDRRGLPRPDHHEGSADHLLQHGLHAAGRRADRPGPAADHGQGVGLRVAPAVHRRRRQPHGLCGQHDRQDHRAGRQGRPAGAGPVGDRPAQRARCRRCRAR